VDDADLNRVPSFGDAFDLITNVFCRLAFSARSLVLSPFQSNTCLRASED